LVDKSRVAGSFLGGIFNNPGVILLGGLAIALFLFRDKISEAVGGLGEGLVNVNLPEIKLPDITFPELPALPELPSLPDIFRGGGVEQETTPRMVEDTGLIRDRDCPCGSRIIQDAFGNVNETCIDCPPELTRAVTQPVPFRDAERFARDFPEPFVERQVTPRMADLNIGGFRGEAQEAPIGALSLSRIIERFGVTASQAANIRFEARQEDQGFDFTQPIIGRESRRE